MPAASRVRFGDFEADLRTGEVRRGGNIIRVQDLPFRLLVALLDRPGELVTRAELRESLWSGGTFVDYEAGLNTAVAKLREALDDDANHPAWVETVRKRGYRFLGRVEAVGDPEPAPHLHAEAISGPTSTPPHRRHWPLVVGASLFVVALVGIAAARWRVSASQTRIAVVMFQNETGQQAFDELAQQLTDTTVLKLTARSDLAVIGNAAVLRTGRPFMDLRAISNALNVRYIVIGQVQETGGAIRVLAHLIRADDQTHLWVDNVPLVPGQEVALQSDVATRVVRAVATRVLKQP